METSEVIALWARKGARISDCGKMCDECAFKRGARGNQSRVSVEDAAQAVAYEMSVFHCHLGEMPVCAGYLYAKAYMASLHRKQQ